MHKKKVNRPGRALARLDDKEPADADDQRRFLNFCGHAV